MRTKEEVIAEVEHLTQIHSTIKEIDEGYINTLIEEAKKYKLWDELVDIYCNWANYLFNTEMNFEKANQILKLCTNGIRKGPKKCKVARFLSVKANYFRMKHQFADAIKFLKLADKAIVDYNLVESNASSLILEFNINIMLYNTYFQLNDYLKAKNYLVISTEIAIRIKEYEYLIICELNNAKLMFVNKEYDKFKMKITKLIPEMRLKGLQYNLAEALRHLGRYNVIMENYLIAINHFKEAYSILVEKFPKLQYAKLLCEIGECYLILRKEEESRYYYELALSKVDLVHNKIVQMDVLKDICLFYTHTKEYEKVVNCMKKVEQIQAEYNIIDRTKSIMEIEEKYKSALREKELKLERKKQAETKQLLQWEKARIKQFREMTGSLQKGLKRPVQTGKQLVELLIRNGALKEEKQEILIKIVQQFQKIEQVNHALSESFDIASEKGKIEKLKAQNILSLLHRQLSGEPFQELFPQTTYPKTHFIQQYIGNLAMQNDAYKNSNTPFKNHGKAIMI